MSEFKATGEGTWDIWSRSDEQRSFSRDSSLFSTSLPVFRHEKLEDHAIEDMLPDDDNEFLAGIIRGLDFDAAYSRMDNNVEEYDLFGSGGGLEIESDATTRESLGFGMSRLNLSDSSTNGNGMARFFGQNSTTVTGEHPLGEHPSRTLFVRNINSNVDDSEIKELFQVYGDIRTLHTSCKHRGFVMISYYDIRAARAALRDLQDKPLRRRKLDIHFSIPKGNPSDKDLNQGTLVVFNLDPSVSNEDLLQIFRVYGEVKEIRETPHKRHHKFIEFYDVRDADAALRSMNRREIAGRRIKLELSRPGGTRRNVMVHSGQDLEPDDPPPVFRHQMAASFGSSSPGMWSPLEQSPLSSLSKSADFRSLSPMLSTTMSDLDSILLPPRASNSTRGVATPTDMNNGGYRSAFQQSLSFPESNSSQFSGRSAASSFGASNNSNGSGIETFLGGNQFLWGSSSPKLYSEQPTTNSSSLRGQSFGPVGSAPSGVRFEKQSGFYQGGFDLRPKDTNFTMNPGARSNVDSRPKDTNFTMNPGPRSNVSSSVNISDSSGYNTMVSPMLSPALFGYSRYQMDNNSKKFELDLEKIRNGEDSRTTLMIKNIPNRYTSNMLLADIDEKNKGTYDFLYLPIDFKNRCNVGYAFINMLTPSHIIPFYEAFNGRKWEKFNSEKVAFLAYGRIQGKAALVSHFENSSLMNVDVHCRPILFHSEEGSSDSGQQENLTSNRSKFQVRRSNGLDTKEPSGRSKDEGRPCVDQP